MKFIKLATVLLFIDVFFTFRIERKKTKKSRVDNNLSSNTYKSTSKSEGECHEQVVINGKLDCESNKNCKTVLEEINTLDVEKFKAKYFVGHDEKTDLDTEVKKSVFWYTKKSYEPINWYLKSNLKDKITNLAINEIIEAEITNLDKHISGNNAFQNINKESELSKILGIDIDSDSNHQYLFRGSECFSSNLKVGGVFILPAYFSTSTSLVKAKEKCLGENSFIFIIMKNPNQVLNGVDIAANSDHPTEKEVLLGRNQYLKLMKHTELYFHKSKGQFISSEQITKENIQKKFYQPYNVILFEVASSNQFTNFDNLLK